MAAVLELIGDGMFQPGPVCLVWIPDHLYVWILHAFHLIRRSV